MNIRYATIFKRQYKKLPKGLQRRFKERIILFVSDPIHPMLRMHPLKGKLAGCWSINITGDIRAVYRVEQDGDITFMLLGTHAELYGK